MTESEFTLKATPPRMPPAAVERERLLRICGEADDRGAILVVAPAGFGKSTLLLQCRQRWLERGATVAWLSADAQDEPARFTMALRQSLRLAQGGEGDDSIPRTASGVEAMTRMLAGIASRGTHTVIVVDDSGQLPDATVSEVLQYLLLNAPPNLHVAIGSRVPLPLRTGELAAKGQCVAVGAEDLRMRVEESIEFIDRRLGPRLGLDEQVRLHEVTEGWPIGLQLVATAIERESEPAAAIRSISARKGTLQDYFAETVMAQLPPDIVADLVRVSILDRLDAGSFASVTGRGDADAGAVLDRLVRETPIMMTGEQMRWIRLHPLARDFLRGRFEELPPEEQAALHARASLWFAANERFHEAAVHALAAGDQKLAQDFAARSLWSLSTSGKLAEAREWLDRLPREMIARDTALRLVAASILALSDRNAEALAFASNVLAEPAASPRSTVVALRIAAGSAAFADRLGLIPALIPRWPGTGDPGGSPLYTMTGLNARAIVALHAGDTAQARELIAQQAVYGSAGELRLAAAHGQMLVGLSHLRDGDPVQAESVLGPRLAEAEAEKRRSTIACLYASVLAAALLDRDQPVAAQTVLANRLDVIERCGFPDNILCAYRALAYVAAGQGDARRALKVLDGLEAIARRRKLPRLYAHALAEQIRIHALGTRMDTVDRLERALEGLAGEFDEAATLPLQREYRLVLALAKVHAALARGELEQADRQLQAAGTLATAMHRRHDVQRTQVLRAVAARLRGDGQALPLLKEANLLADFAGHARLLTDTHPLAVQMLDELESAAGTKPTAIGPHDDAEVASLRPVAQGPELFTSKEAEILDLLDRGLPNKLIATTLDVSGETVKWHLKNVYLKLSVGSRRHAVERARLLGLLPEERQRYGVMARRTGS